MKREKSAQHSNTATSFTQITPSNKAGVETPRTDSPLTATARRTRHGPSRPRPPCAATKQILFAGEILPFLMPAALSATSRRQSAAAGQKRAYTRLGGRFGWSGRGHSCIQPFLHWSETAATHATSSFWCDVVRGRSTDGEVASRGPAALGRWIESNESNQRIISARTAVSTCQTVYLQHIQTYQCFTTLLCSCS